MTETSLKIQNIPTDKLIEYARNPRKNDAVVDKMVACIKEFGFRIPIVAKSDGTVVDGRLRPPAAVLVNAVLVFFIVSVHEMDPAINSSPSDPSSGGWRKPLHGCRTGHASCR